MECNNVNKLIPDYIKNRMKLKDMAPFLRHIKHCRECYDELEVRFLVEKAADFLDNDESSSYDLSKLLESDLKKKRRLLFFAHSVMVLVCLILIGIFVYFSLIRK